ncbi:MAG: spore photoproduct lyase family protein, partial [Janthinobacterium lividum]
LADLCQEVEASWGKRFHPASMSRVVRRLGFSRQKARQVHPQSDAQAQPAFAKRGSGGSRQSASARCAATPTSNRSTAKLSGIMPPALAKLLDVRTSPVAERIAAIGELHRAGYEVHLNFSPVVLREGWEAEWGALFEELDDVLPPAVKDQLATEIIMLTHNRELHEVNLAWHPKAEELLWRPDIQEEKISESGGVNLRYRTGWKSQWLRRFRDLLAARMPYCRVRYAF